MAESNGSWGALAATDPELADTWDSYKPLPAEGLNEPLDSLCERKRITIASLVRIGARLAEPTVLAYAFPDGIKYRSLITDKRWGSAGSPWAVLKIIPASSGEPATTCIIAEGETDAARLTILFPDFDVAAMPAGAQHWTTAFATSLGAYRRVLVGLDRDAAGELGAAKILASLPNAVRYAPEKDWCETAADDLPELPEPPPVMADVVYGGELMDLSAPDTVSWFEHALVPIGGLVLLHGPAKSFKSFAAFDMASAIATGSPWCGFAATEEPARVCVLQFEIPWGYYKQRAARLREASPDPRLWDANFGSWRPLLRAYLAAGNQQHEDAILAGLVAAGAQVLVVDPVRRAMGAADMNSEQDVRKLLNFFERCQREGITVIATHHDGKQASRMGGGDPMGMTGSGAWMGDADTLISLQTPRGETLDSPRRNIRFLLRHDETPADRGFRMTENGLLTYTSEPWTIEDEAVDPENVPTF